MKKTILGNDTNKFQFDLPLEKDPSGHSRRQGIINFKNTKVQKIIDNLELIINISYIDDAAKLKLKKGISDYRKGFFILRKKDSDYSQVELFDYKCYMNSFCTKFVDIFGRKMCTNYFHMVISDHVYDCILE